MVIRYIPDEARPDAQDWGARRFLWRRGWMPKECCDRHAIEIAALICEGWLEVLDLVEAEEDGA